MSEAAPKDGSAAAQKKTVQQVREAEQRLRQSAALSELILLSKFGRQIAQAAIDSAAATAASVASSRTRGTLDARSASEHRGVGPTPFAGLDWNPTPPPIKIPSKLDKVKSWLTPKPPSENEGKHQLEIERDLDEIRRRTNRGRPDPSGTIKGFFPEKNF